MNKIQTCFLISFMAGLSALTSPEQGKPESATTMLKPLSKKIAVIGGLGVKRNSIAQVKCYDFTNQSWDYACLPKIPVGKHNLGVVQIDTKLYAVGGGGSSGSLFKSMDILDLETRMEWSNGTNMGTHRSAHGTAVLNGLIYAVGGIVKLWNGYRDGMVTGEVFNTTEKSWSEIASMSTKRFQFSLVPVGNKLYAIGGLNYDAQALGNKYIDLNIIECYDPVHNSWSTITPSTEMTKRSSPAVAVLNDKIYVAGGWIEFIETATFEMYDPVTKVLQPLRDMANPRGYATMVAFEEELYIFGGHRLNTGEIYNPKNNSWAPFPTNFAEAFQDAASLVITAAF